MNFINRFTLPSLLAAGGLFLGFSASNNAVARDAAPEVAVPTQNAEGTLAQFKIPGLGKKKGGKAAKEEPAKAAPPPEPNPELRAGLECIDGLTPMDVQRGVRREYDVKEGMSTDQRTGFMDREPVEMTNGCFLGELQPNTCFAFTVNEKKYTELGNSNDWSVQCVYSDDAGAGALENKGEYPYQVDSMPGKEMMLLCGHTEGDGYECAEGSNSARSGEWDKKLDKEGKIQLGFCINTKAYQELSYDKDDYPSGRWAYCQYYNSKTKKNMFGYEFLQTHR
ncbi:MAG: hypothetical protein KDA24_08570 [Deltaproteobacteria bacterium]|nr:hypothetical protein [Deltaproteobacteria bacterium]